MIIDDQGKEMLKLQRQVLKLDNANKVLWPHLSLDHSSISGIKSTDLSDLEIFVTPHLRSPRSGFSLKQQNFDPDFGRFLEQKQET